MLIHAMILMALVDFFALKYRQANKKMQGLKVIEVDYNGTLLMFYLSFLLQIFLNISSILNT